MPALGSPSHLHERGNRNRSIGHGDIAAHERVSLERTRTEDANAAVAQIVNTTFKFLWQGTRRLARPQASGMHFEHLGKTLVLAPFLIGGLHHSIE